MTTGVVPVEVPAGRNRPDDELRVRRDGSFGRRSSAAGSDDPYCHLLLGQAPFRYTACLVRLREPLAIEETHDAPFSRCPNRHLACPGRVKLATR